MFENIALLKEFWSVMSTDYKFIILVGIFGITWQIYIFMECIVEPIIQKIKGQEEKNGCS